MANKKKRCKCCGDYGEVSEGVQTPNGFFIDYSHAIKHSIELSRKRTERLLAKAVRAQAVEAKNAAKRDRERMMEVKPLSYWMMVGLALAAAGFTKARIMLDTTAQQEAIQSCDLSLITAIFSAHHVTRTCLET